MRLRIYDVWGRRVRSLLDGGFPAGKHVVVWDGRDERGRAVVRGIYLARLAWPGGSSASRIAVSR